MDERSFHRLLRRTVAIPVALLVLLAVVLVVEILSLTSALRWVDHAEEVVADSRELMRNMTNMETAIRVHCWSLLSLPNRRSSKS